MVAAAQQAFSGASAPVQEEPRGLKRAAADDDCLKDAAVPDAKRLRLAQWLRETPRAVKSALSRAKGQLASSAIALGERPLLERPLLPREGLRRAVAAARGGADSARAAASSVGSTLASLRGGLRAATASAKEAAKLGAGLRGWAAKAASAAEEAEVPAPQADLAAPVQVAPEAEHVVEEPQAPPAPREGATAAAVLAPETAEAAATAPAQQGPEPRCDGSTDASAEVQEVMEAVSADAAADAYDPYAATEAAAWAAAQQAWEPSEAVSADATADGHAVAEAPTVEAAAPAPTRVTATHAYDGAATCGEGFLELRAGDQIVCLSGEAQGWAYGQLVQPAGRSQEAGWFPASYVTPALAAAQAGAA